MSSTPAQACAMTKLASVFTSKQATALVVAGAFAYGFIFSGTKTHERVNLADLLKTPMRSTFLRSCDGSMYAFGANGVISIFPPCTPLLGAAIVASSLYYLLRTPQESSK